MKCSQLSVVFRSSTLGTFLLLMISFSLTSACGRGQSGGGRSQTPPAATPVPTPVADTGESGEVDPLPTGQTGLTVAIVKEKNMTASQTQKLRQAVSALNQVVNSPDFKEKVLNFTYLGVKQFAQNEGMTNEQVYQAVMAAAEKYPKLSPANGIADLAIATYYPPWYKSMTSAVAYTNASDEYLYIYNKYFNSASVPELAKTVFHEWTHKLGFSHDYNATAKRPYTVPYGLGGLVQTAVAAYLEQ